MSVVVVVAAGVQRSSSSFPPFLSRSDWMNWRRVGDVDAVHFSFFSFRHVTLLSSLA